MSGLVSSLELLLRLGAAAILVAANLTLSCWIGWKLVPRATTVVRWLAVIVCGMWIPAVAFQLLVPFRLFTLPVALIASLGILNLLLLRAGPRASLRAGVTREARALRGLAGAIRRSPRRMWLAAFAVCALPVILRPLAVPPFAWDTLMYHGVKASFWVQHGGPALVLDGPGSWDFNRNLFAGGEVFMAWTMLPIHGDLLVGLGQVVEWLALGLALIAVARELGVKEPLASAAAGLVLSCAMVRLEVGSGYVELVLGVAVAGAVAFILRFLRHREPGALVLACAGLGIGCGVKLVVVPVAMIGLAFLYLPALFSRRRPWKAMFAGALVIGATAGPWMAYNIVDTGLPFTPAPVKVGGLWFGRSTASSRMEMSRGGLKPYDLDFELDHVERTFQGPGADKEALGLQMGIAMLVFLLGLPWLLKVHPAGAVFLVLVFAANVGEIFSPGMSVVRLYWPEGVSRFWMSALVATVPASAAWCARFPRLGRVYGWFLGGTSLFMLLRLAAFGNSHYGIEAMAFLALDVVAVAGLALFLPRGSERAEARKEATPERGAAERPGAPRRSERARQQWLRRAGCAALAVALFIGFASYRNGNRYEALAKETVMHNVPRDVAAGARPLDDGAPHVVAVTAGPHINAGNWMVYPYFGRRLQNEVIYVPPTRDGHVERDMGIIARIADHTAWLAHLGERGVTHVVSFPPASVELDWMEKDTARFVRLAGHAGQWGVFRVVPKP